MLQVGRKRKSSGLIMWSEELDKDNFNCILAVIGETRCPSCECLLANHTVKHKCEDEFSCRLDIFEWDNSLHIMQSTNEIVRAIWRLEEKQQPADIPLILVKKIYRPGGWSN